MKYILLLAVLILSCCELCPAQSKYPFSDSIKTITTSVDTIVAKHPAYGYYELTIQCVGADTLLWRTNLEKKWTPVLPGQTFQLRTILLDTLFRKAKNTSTKSSVRGN